MEEEEERQPAVAEEGEGRRIKVRGEVMAVMNSPSLISSSQVGV